MQDLRITYIQAELFWEDIPANLEKFTNILNPLAGKQDLVVLPEMFSTGFSVNPERIAELSGSRTMVWMHDQAKKLDSVLCGTIILKEGGYFYNRMIWMRPDGSYETYDKRHLFKMGNEHLRFNAGRKRLVIDLLGWKIRPLICYDLRFPVWAKNTYTADHYEYDVLIYLANWPEVRRDPWKSLLVSRSMENVAYTFGVNRVGIDGNGITHSGDSVCLDYKGEIISMIPEGTEGIDTVTLSHEMLVDFRSKFNIGAEWDLFNIQL
jgi:predicted amidohydrolase